MGFLDSLLGEHPKPTISEINAKRLSSLIVILDDSCSMRYSTLIVLFGLICNLLCSCEQKNTANQNSSDYVTETSENAVPSDEEQLAELERMCAKWPEESFEERFESMNPWQKGYFCNEWGEEILTSPYLYVTLAGSGWNIHIDYHQTADQPIGGVFRIYILDRDGYKTDLYSPVRILVRGSDGETKVVKTTGVDDSIIYIEDTATVEGLKEYFNKEQFDLLLEFDKWNERHSTKTQWFSDEGFFQYAIDTML